MFRRETSCLVLIDLQEGFHDPKWGERNNPLLERYAAALLSAFRESNLPVIHVRHNSAEAASPLRSGGKGFAFLKSAQPQNGEEIFTKRAHGAFVGTKLEAHLRWRGITDPVLAGLTSDHCVNTTARMACDLGFSPLLVSDATATFPRRAPGGHWLSANDVQEAALASLDGEFARVVTTAQILHQLRSNL
ncbi:MAG: cysteine hydrolase family protein, partial [Bdellovibrionota bacterium]